MRKTAQAPIIEAAYARLRKESQVNLLPSRRRFALLFALDRAETRTRIYRARCRRHLARITREIAERYAREQCIEEQDDAINRHWRTA